MARIASLVCDSVAVAHVFARTRVCVVVRIDAGTQTSSLPQPPSPSGNTADALLRVTAKQ
jgi:hypothetical protein